LWGLRLPGNQDEGTSARALLLPREEQSIRLKFRDEPTDPLFIRNSAALRLADECVFSYGLIFRHKTENIFLGGNTPTIVRWRVRILPEYDASPTGMAEIPLV